MNMPDSRVGLIALDGSPDSIPRSRADAWLKDTWNPDGSIDLAGVAPVCVEVALLALARMSERARDRVPVRMRFPAQHTERERLRRWSFQQACEASAGTSFLRLVDREDRRYFGEARIDAPLEVWSDPNDVDAFVSRLEQDGFFGLTTYSLTVRGALTRMIRHEWARWRHVLILELLEAHSRGPGPDVARVLVHELLANAIQHPEASMVVLGASVEGLDSADPQLVVAVWDDGDSIVKTLRDCVGAGVRATETTVNDEFRIRTSGWSPSKSTLPASWAPDADSHDGELLLASLLPGISRKPQAPGFPVVDRPEVVDWENKTGFGLHALYRSAIDAFGGDVHIWSDSYSLHLSGAPAPTTTFAYDVDVQLLADVPPLMGNLIAIRLPITR